MHPQAEALAQQFISDFWAANHDIKWLAVEEERRLQLDPQTFLVGRVDARGITPDGEPFFGEWKSISKNRARYMDSIKAEWRFSPQALTYGVLIPECHRFTVRWAVKDTPPRTDFEWYTYTDAEVACWRHELIEIADLIRQSRGEAAMFGDDHWRLNPLSCFRYGFKYRCPFYDGACSQLKFDAMPPQMKVRTPHLDIERKMRDTGITRDPNIVVLDASRTETWLECNEKYRRVYEGEGATEEGEALVIGGDMHALIGAHIQAIQQEQGAKHARVQDRVQEVQPGL